MISKERWEQIGQMAAAGSSISAIARELDLDRKMVRHSLRKQQWTPYRHTFERAMSSAEQTAFTDYPCPTRASAQSTFFLERTRLPLSGSPLP